MDDQIKKKYWLMIKIGGATMLLGIALMFIFPILFTQFTSKYDFTETGQIGDTIGGITAPIAAIIGSILVFISFLEQWKANQIQSNNIENNRCFEILDRRVNELPELFIKNYNEGNKNMFGFLSSNDLEFGNFLLANTVSLYKSYHCLSLFKFVLKQLGNSKELKKEQLSYLEDKITILVIEYLILNRFYEIKTLISQKQSTIIGGDADKEFYKNYKMIMQQIDEEIKKMNRKNST